MSEFVTDYVLGQLSSIEKRISRMNCRSRVFSRKAAIFGILVTGYAVITNLRLAGTESEIKRLNRKIDELSSTDESTKGE